MYELGAFCRRNNDADNAGKSIFNMTTARYSGEARDESEK